VSLVEPQQAVKWRGCQCIRGEYIAFSEMSSVLPLIISSCRLRIQRGRKNINYLSGRLHLSGSPVEKVSGEPSDQLLCWRRKDNGNVRNLFVAKVLLCLVCMVDQLRHSCKYSMLVVQIIEDGVIWENVEWSPSAIWVRGREFPLTRVQFMSKIVPLGS
jgi:hypothetical protein